MRGTWPLFREESSTRCGATRTSRWSTYSRRRARTSWRAAGQPGYATKKAEDFEHPLAGTGDPLVARPRGMGSRHDDIEAVRSLLWGFVSRDATLCAVKSPARLL